MPDAWDDPRGYAAGKTGTYSGHGIRFKYYDDMEVGDEPEVQDGEETEGETEGGLRDEVPSILAQCEQSSFLFIEVHPKSLSAADILDSLWKEHTQISDGTKWAELDARPSRRIMGKERTGKAAGAKGSPGWLKKEMYAFAGERHNFGLYVHYLTDSCQQKLANRYFSMILGSLEETESRDR